MSVVLLILSVAGVINAVVSAVKTLTETEFDPIVVVCIFSAISALLAIFYCLFGYKKSAASVLQAYCVTMTIERMVTLYLMSRATGYEFNIAIQFFTTLAQCGIWFVLTIAKDLGKKKTFALVESLLVLAVVFVIAVMLYYDTSFALGSMPLFVSYIITFIMFYGKYQDKEARGTK